MDSIVSQIHSLAQSTGEAGRLEIQRALRQTQVELQSPIEVLFELVNSTLGVSVVRMSTDLGLFGILAKSSESLSVNKIAEASGASPDLLARILRYLASTNMIMEAGVNQYEANKTTHVFASEKGEAMVLHGFDFHAVIMRVMPDFFKETKYQDVTSNKYIPFHKAFNTNLSCFDWLIQHPEHFTPFQKAMTSIEGSEWTEGFDLLESEIKKLPSTAAQSSERTFLVDIGGGHGHQSIQLGQKYPNVLGRLVLQDLPTTVENLAIEGVKVEAYDFFQKQPLVGAKFYYLRRVLHDWPDNDATKILRNVAEAMSTDSRVLIDDTVLPDTEAVWQGTMADLALMISCGGKERTRRQWELLADAAGLRVEQIHSYVAATYTSIVVLALK
ncbi:hypothetical protein N7532_009502 [Penicillium argentinense]|uniref:O-methyltransferase domain-containing protein n=1 Tax=Penicillium argentinense TaxID=1131581 RepID=A0A9W9EZE7_9EURO|nr:uncharacterized protein N7532_009502 [Penicillium argentinense]KAJ5090818.1 hypothetical protein N7532_009502 [Penicillium argentinense]